MTTARKVALVNSVRGEYGLAPALRAVELAPSTWHYQGQRQTYSEKYEELRAPMLAIAQESPDYGYRRMTDELSTRVERRVNAKVVRNLLQTWGLAHVRKPAPPRKSAVRRVIDEVGDRADLIRDLDEVGVYQVLVTDFTELIYSTGKAVLMPLLDLGSKDVVGWALGQRRSTRLALQAWERARRRLLRLGITSQGLIVHHDRDSVYTSEDWVRTLLITGGVRLSYALRGPRDNAEMESWNGRFKQENADLFLDAKSLGDLEKVVRKQMRYYTEKRRHSSLGNQAPRIYVREALSKEE